jgi:polyhydroxybutyrate depolymerase
MERNKVAKAWQLGRSRWPRSAAAYGIGLLATAIAACGSAAGPTSTPTPGAVLHRTLSVSGLERSYRLFRPSLEGGAKVSLVIVLHDHGESGDDIADRTGYDQQASKNRFIVVYPNGIGGSWNAGTCCSPATDQGVDDVKFIHLLIDQVASQQPVDISRVFVTGFSNGAAMTYRLACELADQIRAIGSVSGGILVDSCQPAVPISVLEIHGSKDYAFPLEGSTLPPTIPPLATEMQQWVTSNGCTASPDVAGDAAVRISTWDSCRNQTVVKLELVEGGSHVWFARATTDTWQFFNGR